MWWRATTLATPKTILQKLIIKRATCHDVRRPNRTTPIKYQMWVGIHDPTTPSSDYALTLKGSVDLAHAPSHLPYDKSRVAGLEITRPLQPGHLLGTLTRNLQTNQMTHPN